MSFSFNNKSFPEITGSFFSGDLKKTLKKKPKFSGVLGFCSFYDFQRSFQFHLRNKTKFIIEGKQIKL